MRRESFERFYLEKVALGEGCGCAEHVTRMREIDALGRRPKAERTNPAPAMRLFAALGAAARRPFKAAWRKG